MSMRMEDLIEAHQRRSLHIDFTRMTLRRGDDEVSGPGYLITSQNGQLEYRIYRTTGSPLDVLYSDPHEPGRLPSAEEYWHFEGIDIRGDCWTNPKVCAGSIRFSGETVLLGELQYVTVMRESSFETYLQVTFHQDFYFPCNNFTRTVESVGGQQTLEKATRNLAILELAEYQVQVGTETGRNVFVMRRKESEEPMPPHLHRRLQESLQFVFALQMDIASVLYGSKSEDRLMLISASTDTVSAKLYPPINWKQPAHAFYVYRMLNAYFSHICSDTRDGWHPLGSRHYDLLCASTSHDALSLAVCATSEYLANVASGKHRKVADKATKETTKKAVNELKKHVHEMAIPCNIQERLRKAIDIVLQPSINDSLYRLTEQEVIRKELVDEWKKTASQDCSWHKRRVRTQPTTGPYRLCDDAVLLPRIPYHRIRRSV